MYPTTYLSARDEGGKLRRLNPLSITYTRPIRSRRNNPTVKVMRELPRKKYMQSEYTYTRLHFKSNNHRSSRVNANANSRDFRRRRFYMSPNLEYSG
ncbi:unnamed protein product, partial [Trichogramma brassicae]